MNFIKKHLKKGFQFCLIGSVGAIINLSIQYVLVESLGIYFLVAAIIGILGGMLFNYFLNYYWTFKRKDPLDQFVNLIQKRGFNRTVFERILPMPTLNKTTDGVLFDDQSPRDFYPTVIVPEYLIGKTLFIIDKERLDKFIAKSKS